MYIVVAGAGEVGYYVAKALVTEGHDLAIIETDPDKLGRTRALDALVITGNAASPAKLEEANIDAAQAFIAVTGNDEINILSSMIAHTRGVKTIARVNNLDYINEPLTSNLAHLGVDIAICPELVSAIRMARIITMPSMLDADVFAGGRVRVIETHVAKQSIAAGKRLRRLKIPNDVNIVAILREHHILIPSGATAFRPDDRVVMVVVQLSKIAELREIFGTKELIQKEPEIRRVMIMGATRIGLHLARLFLYRDTKVILVERSRRACERAVERLSSNVLVVHGDGLDKELLLAEGIKNADAYIATTSHEETNVLSCLLARRLGAKKVIALIEQPEHKSMLEDIGMDLAIDPRMATINTILKSVHSKDLLSLAVMSRGEAQVVELRVAPRSRIVGKKVKNARLPKNTVLGAIIRKDRVIIPRGETAIETGDRVIIFTQTDSIMHLKRLFRHK